MNSLWKNFKKIEHDNLLDKHKYIMAGFKGTNEYTYMVVEIRGSDFKVIHILGYNDNECYWNIGSIDNIVPADRFFRLTKKNKMKVMVELL